MKVTPDEANDRVSKLEHSLDFVNFRLAANEKILEEIKDAVKQLVVLNQQQHALKDDIQDLRKDFEDRKIKTDPVIDKAEQTIGRIYGVASVVCILFSVIVWVGTTNINRIGELEKVSNTFDTSIQVLKAEVSQFHKGN